MPRCYQQGREIWEGCIRLGLSTNRTLWLTTTAAWLFSWLWVESESEFLPSLHIEWKGMENYGDRYKTFRKINKDNAIPWKTSLNQNVGHVILGSQFPFRVLLWIGVRGRFDTNFGRAARLVIRPDLLLRKESYLKRYNQWCFQTRVTAYYLFRGTLGNKYNIV